MEEKGLKSIQLIHYNIPVAVFVNEKIMSKIIYVHKITDKQ